MMQQNILTYINHNETRFLEELCSFLRIPSISTDLVYRPCINEAAQFLAHRLKEAGANNVSVIGTNGHPVVYGEKIVDRLLPTVLVYGHYDVQPADPIDLWNSDPFEPKIIDDKIYARGACDDKGQLYMHLKVLEFFNTKKQFPCNMKFILEGEEEIGSVNLKDFIRKNKSKLAADVVLISDTAIYNKHTPTIITGLKGICYVEVEITGPDRDLHSGIYGGAVGNPLNEICKAIGKLKDDHNRITIPGFYDNIQKPNHKELAAIKKLNFDLVQFKADLGLMEVDGEVDYSTLERLFYRPTLDVNGIVGGYTNSGAKTVLPSKAMAKISMRLVPGQDADDISLKFENYFASLLPGSVSVKFTRHAKCNPILTKTNSMSYQAASEAMVDTFGKEPIPVRIGGSIPVVNFFKEVMELDTILMGFGFDSDNIHSPNEHFGIWNFKKGIETIALFYKQYATLQSQKIKIKPRQALVNYYSFPRARRL